jgi:2-oxoglutarate ferredoxin oxidoreductase subunit gamma
MGNDNREAVTEEVIAAGFGGQGIMLLGKLLATAGMHEEKHVTFLPSYGAEVRGGTAHCHVSISSGPIASPVIEQARSLVIMNHPSLVKFEQRLLPGGRLFANSSMMQREPERDDIEVTMVPASDIARDLGSLQVANMVMLGCYLAKSGVVKLETVIEAMKEVVPARYHKMLKLNETALRRGDEFGQGPE